MKKIETYRYIKFFHGIKLSKMAQLGQCKILIRRNNEIRMGQILEVA